MRVPSGRYLVQSGPMSGALLLAGAFLLVLLNAFFVLAEFAIVKVRATRVEELAREGSLAARWARHMTLHLDGYLSATQVGITIASLGLGWIGEPAIARLIQPPLVSAGVLAPVLAHTVAVTIAFLAITFLHVVLGELAPKSLAIRRPVAMALAVAIPLRAFYFLFFPLIWFFNASAAGVLRLSGLSPGAPEDIAHTEEELRMILLRSREGGRLGHLRSDLIENLLDFTRLTARQIMVPRTDVVYLSTERPLDENLAILRDSGHTRFPLCRGGLDQVVGIVHIKDIFGRPGAPPQLPSIMREALFVPETMPADRLLRTFQRRRLHMAVVVDEYGGASGIVTLEDVLEEIVGEVQDEFDREEPEVETKGGGIVSIEGSARLEDVLDRLHVALDEEDRPEVDTIGGFVQAVLRRLARPGDRIALGDYELRVVDARGARVRRIEARRRVGADEPDRGDAPPEGSPVSGHS